MSNSSRCLSFCLISSRSALYSADDPAEYREMTYQSSAKVLLMKALTTFYIKRTPISLFWSRLRGNQSHLMNTHQVIENWSKCLFVCLFVCLFLKWFVSEFFPIWALSRWFSPYGIAVTLSHVDGRKQKISHELVPFVHPPAILWLLSVSLEIGCKPSINYCPFTATLE